MGLASDDAPWSLSRAASSTCWPLPALLLCDAVGKVVPQPALHSHTPSAQGIWRLAQRKMPHCPPWSSWSLSPNLVVKCFKRSARHDWPFCPSALCREVSWGFSRFGKAHGGAEEERQKMVIQQLSPAPLCLSEGRRVVGLLMPLGGPCPLEWKTFYIHPPITVIPPPPILRGTCRVCYLCHLSPSSKWAHQTASWEVLRVLLK